MKSPIYECMKSKALISFTYKSQKRITWMRNGFTVSYRIWCHICNIPQISTYIYIYIYMCVCIHVYTHTHTHTHTHFKSSKSSSFVRLEVLIVVLLNHTGNCVGPHQAQCPWKFVPRNWCFVIAKCLARNCVLTVTELAILCRQGDRSMEKSNRWTWICEVSH
jgi:hypothetical protein